MDTDDGGFQGAPKFPQFYIFETLFYFYQKNRKRKFLEPVEKLLKNISSRGIYDQLAGGIARYTVDKELIVAERLYFVRLILCSVTLPCG